jgi:hypothetical protein
MIFKFKANRQVQKFRAHRLKRWQGANIVMQPFHLLPKLANTALENFDSNRNLINSFIQALKINIP